ncbi:MAG: hypothetical protein IH623_26725 [Verrucomicrobia bacterium]|nr:hypothetical protein [Verrucomicrobiota bacterium]
MAPPKVGLPFPAVPFAFGAVASFSASSQRAAKVMLRLPPPPSVRPDDQSAVAAKQRTGRGGIQG